MIFLTSTSDIIQVITSAAGSIRVHSTWIDNASGTVTPGRTNLAAITSATTTTAVVANADVSIPQHTSAHVSTYVYVPVLE